VDEKKERPFLTKGVETGTEAQSGQASSNVKKNSSS